MLEGDIESFGLRDCSGKLDGEQALQLQQDCLAHQRPQRLQPTTKTEPRLPLLAAGPAFAVSAWVVIWRRGVAEICRHHA